MNGFAIAGTVLSFSVLSAALAGRLITRRALKPVRRIIEAAERVGEGRDLSRRIPAGGGGDEISALAGAFNDMFERLERSFEREKQFTLDASHELRTPVAAIVSRSEYALANARSAEEAKEALSVVLAQARRMSGLISQLRMLSRTGMECGMLTFERLSLSEFTEMVAEEQREAANEKNIEIRTRISPDLYVRADETMMVRMLINLISNAITYGRPGGRITVSLAGRGEEAVGTVADDGIGIAEEHLPRIWDRFYRVTPSGTAEGGAGLGLSMVKWILEAHGGGISADSKLGEGSVFTFVLPLTD